MDREVWAARPRILDTVLSGASARLTVIRAPSGYGKTVVLEQLREHLGSQAALLRLSERHASGDALRDELDALIGAAPVTHLLLDDYDAVASSAGARAALEERVLATPAPARIVLATRTRPDLPLGRLRGMRALQELGAREIAFTARELHEVVTDSWGLPDESVDIDALLGVTEGWIAGAALLVDSLGRGSAGAPGADASWPAFEYFAEITDRRLDAELLDFAMSSSLLTTVDPESCARLTGDARAGDHLRELLDRSLFIDSSAPGGTRYRFHPLFRAYLNDRLARTRTRDEVTELHERAARALVDTGDSSRALIHLLRAGRPERAASLLEEMGIGQIQTESLGEIEELLSAEDGVVMSEHPWLLALLGRLKRLRNDFDGALAALKTAALAFHARDDDEGQAWVSSEVSQVHYRDEAYAGSVSQVRRDLDNESLSPITRANLSAHLCWLLAETGPVDQAIAAGEAALSRGTVIGDAVLRSRVLGRAHRNLALASLYCGNVDRALALVGQALIDSVGDDFELAWTNVITAAALATRGEFAEAQDLLVTIVRRTTPYTSTQIRWAYWWIGNVMRAQGRSQDAQSAYEVAGSIASVDDAVLRRGRHGPQLLVAVAGQLSTSTRGSESALRRAGSQLVHALARDQADTEASLAQLVRVGDALVHSGHLLHAASIAAYRARLLAQNGELRESREQFDDIAGFMIHNRIAMLPWGVFRQPDGPLSFADRLSTDFSGFAATIESCPDPAIRERLAAAHRDLGPLGPVVEELRRRGLTWREVDIFVVYYLRAGTALGDGSSLRDRTARTLGISEHTLKSHITRIRAKVHEVESRDTALRWISAMASGSQFAGGILGASGVLAGHAPDEGGG